MTAAIDAEFLSLPLDSCADAGIGRARDLGASHVDVRVVSTLHHHLRLRDARLEGSVIDEDRGLAVRVLVDGCWGFSASDVVTP